MSAPNSNQGAPEYKAKPSIDGTTVNNGTGNSNHGKAPSPTNSEEHDPYVTDETPRTRRAAVDKAPPPGVMVSFKHARNDLT